MKILGLMRHAKSDLDDRAVRDFDRGINERGRQGAALMGEHVRARAPHWNRIVASPAKRVRMTLESAFPQSGAEFDERLYLASTETILEVLRERGKDAEAVLLVGHNPALHEMLSLLVAEQKEDALFDQAMPKFPTATFAQFTLDIAHWKALEAGCGSLTMFTRPRDLDQGLGPELD